MPNQYIHRATLKREPAMELSALLVAYTLYFVPLGFAISLSTPHHDNSDLTTSAVIVLVVTSLHNLAGFVIVSRSDKGWRAYVGDRYSRIAPLFADVAVSVAFITSIYLLASPDPEGPTTLATAIVATVGNALCAFDNFYRLWQSKTPTKDFILLQW